MTPDFSNALGPEEEPLPAQSSFGYEVRNCILGLSGLASDLYSVNFGVGQDQEKIHDWIKADLKTKRFEDALKLARSYEERCHTPFGLDFINFCHSKEYQIRALTGVGEISSAISELSELCEQGRLRCPFGTPREMESLILSTGHSIVGILRQQPQRIREVAELVTALGRGIIFAESLSIGRPQLKRPIPLIELANSTAVLVETIAQISVSQGAIEVSTECVNQLHQIATFLTQVEKTFCNSPEDPLRDRCRESRRKVRESNLDAICAIEKRLRADAERDPKQREALLAFYDSASIERATEFMVSNRNITSWCKARLVEVRSHQALGNQNAAERSFGLITGLLSSHYPKLDPIPQVQLLMSLGGGLMEALKFVPREFEAGFELFFKAATELCNRSVETLDSLPFDEKQLYADSLAILAGSLSNLSLAAIPSARHDVIIPSISLAARLLNIADFPKPDYLSSIPKSQIVPEVCDGFYTAMAFAAQALSRADKYEMAVSLFDAVAFKIPDPIPKSAPLVRSHFETFNCFMTWANNCGDYGRAFEVSERVRALVENPAVPEESKIQYWIIRSQAAKNLGKDEITKEARRALEAVIESDAGSGKDLSRYGPVLRELFDSALHEDDLSDAARARSILFILDSNAPEDRLTKAAILSDKGATETAESILDQLKKDENSKFLSSIISLAQARNFERAGDYAGAEDHFKSAISEFEGSVAGSTPVLLKLLRNYERFLRKLNREEEADQLAQRAGAIEFVMKFRSKKPE